MDRKIVYKNYYKNEHKLLEFLGDLWTPEKSSRSGVIKNMCFILIQLLFSITCSILTFIDAFVNSYSLNDLLNRLFVPIVLVSAVFKGYFFLKYNREFKKLLKAMTEEVDFEPETLEEEKIVINNMKFYQNIKLIFAVSFSLSCSIALLVPTERNQNLPYAYPFEVSRSPIFELVFMHQFITVLLLVSAYTFPDIAMIGSSIFIGLQYDLMCCRLVHLENTRSLKSIVLWHHKVLR